VSAEAVELSADEKTLWSGRAERLPWFVLADLFLVPFTVVWTVMVIIFAASASTRNPAEFAIPVLFAAVGLYISIGRILVRRRIWRRSTYTLTNQRVVVKRGSNEDSDWLDRLPPPVTSGKHTVGFGSNGGIQYRLAMEGWPGASWGGNWGMNRHPIFVGLTDAEYVRGLLRNAQSEARRSRSTHE